MPIVSDDIIYHLSGGDSNVNSTRNCNFGISASVSSDDKRI